MYSPCGYRCSVIIKIALAPAPSCSSCPCLIQLHQRVPKGVSHVLSDKPADHSHPTAGPCTSCAQLPLRPPPPPHHPFLGSRMKDISASLGWVYGKERRGQEWFQLYPLCLCHAMSSITMYVCPEDRKLQRSWEMVNKGFCPALWCYGKPGERTRCLICGNWETFGVWQRHPFFWYREFKD